MSVLLLPSSSASSASFFLKKLPFPELPHTPSKHILLPPNHPHTHLTVPHCLVATTSVEKITNFLNSMYFLLFKFLYFLIVDDDCASAAS